MVGDQSGVIHLWDLRSDHNEQLVFVFLIFRNLAFVFLKFKSGNLRKNRIFTIILYNLLITYIYKNFNLHI